MGGHKSIHASSYPTPEPAPPPPPVGEWILSDDYYIAMGDWQDGLLSFDNDTDTFSYVNPVTADDSIGWLFTIEKSNITKIRIYAEGYWLGTPFEANLKIQIWTPPYLVPTVIYEGLVPINNYFEVEIPGAPVTLMDADIIALAPLHEPSSLRIREFQFYQLT
jgi:hypothetical protein